MWTKQRIKTVLDFIDGGLEQVWGQCLTNFVFTQTDKLNMFSLSCPLPWNVITKPLSPALAIRKSFFLSFFLMLQLFLPCESTRSREDANWKPGKWKHHPPPVNSGQELRRDPETTDLQVWRSFIFPTNYRLLQQVMSSLLFPVINESGEVSNWTEWPRIGFIFKSTRRLIGPGVHRKLNMALRFELKYVK